MMLNKTFYLLLLSLIPIFGFSQANSQYPDSGNKIRLGFQTSGDGLIWRDTQPKAGGYQPINNKAAWIILDTMNNKFYHYKNSTWILAGGQDIDTANLIATKYDLGFKLATTDTGDMLTPYWRSGRFSGVLPVANGGTNTNTLNQNKVMVGNGTSGVLTPTNLHWDNTNSRLGINRIPGSYALDITGDLRITGELITTENITLGNGASQTGFIINSSGATNQGPIIRLVKAGVTKGYIGVSSGIIGGTSDDLSSYSVNSITFHTKNQSTTKMILDTIGRLGVGQTTPTAVLHLKAGTATASTAPFKFTSGVALTTPEVGAMEFSNISGTNRLLISPADNVRKEIAYTDFTNASGVLPVANGGTGQTTLAAAGINTGSGTLNYLPKYTAATTFGNSLIFDNGSNVGIGTASPTAGFLLQLTGTNSRFAMFNSSGNTSNFSQMAFGNGGGTGQYAEFYRQNNTKRFHIYNDGGDIGLSTRIISAAYIYDIYLNTSGNVGIGTTSPTYKLDVNGTGRFVDSLFLGNAIIGKTKQNNNSVRFGINAGLSTGDKSVAIGTDALQNDVGGENVAIGFEAGKRLTTGVRNMLLGSNAGSFLTTAGSNVAVGGTALFNMVTGGANVAVGRAAMEQGTTGFFNTAIGNATLLNTEGDYNTAVGNNAGWANSVNKNTTGSNNIFIGNDAVGVSSTQSNHATIGNSSTTTYRMYAAGWTNVSDSRDKTDILPLNYGMNFIDKLKPVSFVWDMRDGGKIGIPEIGFIAQDLQQAQIDSGINVPNLVSGTEEKLEASYGVILPIVVKALQEANEKIKSLEQRIINLENK